MNKKIINNLIIILSTMLLLPSCREDVIAPGNVAGNVNEPIRLKSNSSYTFIINADNISATVFDYSGISSTHSKLLLSIDDYTQGRVSFNIYDYSNQVVYQRLMADNIDQIFASLEGRTPDIIQINFIDFTGKLKIQVYIN